MNDRQKQIVEAAIPLFLAEGVGVSTASIAKAASISNGSLFSAFPTKQDLIDTIYVTIKSEMYAALTYAAGDEFNRENLRRNWCDYLEWAKRNPSWRRVMHLLLDAGLASTAAIDQVFKLATPHNAWFNEAFKKDVIRGPSVEYIGKLAFFHLDLVIAQSLEGDDEALAFEMLCKSIGLSK